MTREEAIICKIYLEDLDKYHTCNEYKLLMGLLEQEPCEDCVSRQYLVEKAVSWDKHFADGIRYVALTDILNAPSVTPSPRIGRWMNTGHCEEWYTYVLECSLCGGEIMWGGKFCPSCGARMSEEAEE